MTERDRFELDLADALRAYAEEASVQVRPTELARQFATAYPHGRFALGPWGLGSTVRLAWVPILLAGLLIAMLGGMLIIGSQPARETTAVLPPVGEVFTCPPGANPEAPGPVDQARPPVDARTAMAFDRRAGKLVAIVDVDDDVATWTFDVCTNTWTQMHPSQEPFGWVELAYDVDSDLTIGVVSCRNCDVVPTGIAWAYDLEANTWTEKGAAPRDVTSLVYDTVAGLVVAAAPLSFLPELWTYDVDTDAWTPLLTASPATLPGPHAGGADHWAFAYDASVDRIIAYGDPTLLLDLRTGTVSRSGTEWPGVWGKGWVGGPAPAIAYDEAAERTVVYGNGRAAVYDAAADHWEVLVDADPRRSDWSPSSMVYDPVNERLVVYGETVRTTDGSTAASPDDVLAFDTRTREWTVLLEIDRGTVRAEPRIAGAPTRTARAGSALARPGRADPVRRDWRRRERSCAGCGPREWRSWCSARSQECQPWRRTPRRPDDPRRRAPPRRRRPCGSPAPRHAQRPTSAISAPMPTASSTSGMAPSGARRGPTTPG